MKRRESLALALIAGTMVVGCERPSTAPPPVAPGPAPTASREPAPTPAPPTIRIQPEVAGLLAGDPGLQLIVDGPGEHGGRVDLTARVGWTTEPPGVVEVDSGGYLRAIRPGKARVRATSGPSRAEAEVTVGDAPRAWSFAQDVSPILTRAGCNGGSCHGRADGQNGFHLSFTGYDPEGDHRALTRDLGERRLSTFRPESSLFLAKATGAISHVGGPRIAVDSPEYRTLLAWLKAGVPYETAGNHGKLAGLAVEPGEVRLDEPGAQQLRVVARFADGHRRDVTRLASYRVLDDSVVEVDGRGLARLLRRAEADLVVRYGTEVVSTRLATLVNPGLTYDFAARARANFIDDALFRRLESLRVPPSPPAPDATGETTDPRYRDLSRDELFRVLQNDAMYVATESGQHFTAPVWISEFGVDGNAPVESKQRTWFTNFTDFLIQADADFAYWPAVGFTENRGNNGWGLLFWDRAGTLTGLDGWRAPIWNRLVASGRTGPVEAVTPWSMLSPDHGDFVASLRMRAEPDWDPGARKATCPDGQRLAGLAHTGNRALCTGGRDWTTHQVVRGEQYVTSDWASRYTKLQCPAGSLLVGYSVRGAAMSSALCASSPDAAGTSAGRTVWFDRSDNRPDGNPGGEFATGRYKGQCATNEYVAGIAYTGRAFSSRTPDALFCRSLVS